MNEIIKIILTLILLAVATTGFMFLIFYQANYFKCISLEEEGYSAKMEGTNCMVKVLTPNGDSSYEYALGLGNEYIKHNYGVKLGGEKK